MMDILGDGDELSFARMYCAMLWFAAATQSANFGKAS